MEPNEVEQLHRDALVIDSHNDSIVSRIRRGNLSITGREAPHLADRDGTVFFLRGPLETEAYAWNGQIDLPKMRAIRDRHLNKEKPPASTLVVVSRLARPGWLIEIEVVAAID